MPALGGCRAAPCSEDWTDSKVVTGTPPVFAGTPTRGCRDEPYRDLGTSPPEIYGHVVGPDRHQDKDKYTVMAAEASPLVGERRKLGSCAVNGAISSVPPSDELLSILQVELHNGRQRTETHIRSLCELLAQQQQQQMEELVQMVCSKITVAHSVDACPTLERGMVAAGTPGVKLAAPGVDALNVQQVNSEPDWIGKSTPVAPASEASSQPRIGKRTSAPQTPEVSDHGEATHAPPAQEPAYGERQHRFPRGATARLSEHVEVYDGNDGEVQKLQHQSARDRLSCGPERTVSSRTDPGLSRSAGRTRRPSQSTVLTACRRRTTHLVEGAESGHPSCRRRIREVVESNYFDYVSLSIILVNAAVIGAQTNWTIQHIGEPMPDAFRALELSFTVWFTLELCLRVTSQGLDFLSWRNREIKWNCLDLLIVTSALTELLLSMMASSLGLSGIRVLRILRFVRIIRVVRVMQFFRDLRVMIAGILHCVKALFWCIILLLLIMFLFATMFTQFVTEAIQGEIDDGADADGASELEIPWHYSTLMRTLFSLFQAISGGVDWGDVSEPLLEIHPILGLLFAVYIAFAVLCVLNVVTSVFVEKSNDNVLEDLVALDNHIQGIKAAMEDQDVEWRDITLDRLERQLQQGHIQQYFAKLGLVIDDTNSYALFDILDFDCNGKVDVDEFVNGCAELCMAVRSIDVLRMRHEIKRQTMKLCDIQDFIESHFDRIERALLLSNPQAKPEDNAESSSPLRPALRVSACDGQRPLQSISS